MTNNQNQEPQLESKVSETQVLFTAQDLTQITIEAKHQPHDVGVVSWCSEELNEH